MPTCHLSATPSLERNRQQKKRERKKKITIKRKGKKKKKENKAKGIKKMNLIESLKNRRRNVTNVHWKYPEYSL